MSKHKLEDATDEILKHYGVEGMKWDVRRTPEQLAAARGAKEAAAQAIEDDYQDQARGAFPELYELMDKGKALLAKVDGYVDSIEDAADSVGDSVANMKSKGKGLLSAFSRKIDAKVFTRKEFKQQQNAKKRASDVQRKVLGDKRKREDAARKIGRERETRAKLMTKEAQQKGQDIRRGTRRNPRLGNSIGRNREAEALQERNKKSAIRIGGSKSN